MTYPTSANFKTWRNITVTTDDTQIGWIISDAIKAFEVETGRESFVAPSATSRKLPLNSRFVSEDKFTLFTRGMEFTQVSSITNGDGQTIPSSAYILTPYEGPCYWSIELLPTAGYVWSGPDPIDITAKWGYSDSCPSDVFLAILNIANLEYNARSGGAVGTPIQTGRGLLLTPADWPTSVHQCIDRYRRG